MTSRLPATLAVLAALALVAGCSRSNDSTAEPTPSQPTASVPSSSAPTSSAPTESTSPTAPSTATSSVTTAAPGGGTSSSPAPVTAGTEVLPWQPVGGSTQDTVTVGGSSRLNVLDGGASAQLSGPHPATIKAVTGYSITDGYLDEHYALVVTEDKLASKPDIATVVDLASGRTTTLNGSSAPPTSVGGTWALGQGRAVHATAGPHHSYCLATVDLASGSGTRGFCVAPRSGFSRAAITPDGESLLTFDDRHPSCRTPVTVDGSHATPLTGVTDCKGWDSALLPGGAIWSVVPNSHRIDAAHFYARKGDSWFDLGPGTSGSLVVCGGAAYFGRDPGGTSDPASLLRWTPDGHLSVVFQSKGTGNAFLAPVRCGGGHLTVNAFTSAGDQEVTVAVG